MITEIFKRICLIVFGGYIFEMPPLYLLRDAIFRRLFNAGKNCSFKCGTKIIRLHTDPDNPATIKMGTDVFVGYNSIIDYSGGLVIGNNVGISLNVTIFTHDHPAPTRKLRSGQPLLFSPLEIGDDVRLGSNVIILASVKRIGKGAVVGAGAVVTKDVEDYAIVAGNPARVIGQRKD